MTAAAPPCYDRGSMIVRRYQRCVECGECAGKQYAVVHGQRSNTRQRQGRRVHDDRQVEQCLHAEHHRRYMANMWREPILKVLDTYGWNGARRQPHRRWSSGGCTASAQTARRSAETAFVPDWLTVSQHPPQPPKDNSYLELTQMCTNEVRKRNEIHDAVPTDHCAVRVDLSGEAEQARCRKKWRHNRQRHGEYRRAAVRQKLFQNGLLFSNCH